MSGESQDKEAARYTIQAPDRPTSPRRTWQQFQITWVLTLFTML
jgi:hypothetical protein